MAEQWLPWQSGFTESGGTAVTSGAVVYPAYSVGDLLVVGIAVDDDATNNNLQTPTAGPDGEELLLDLSGSGGESSAGPTQGLVAWVATSNEASGTITFTWTGTEDWSGNVMRVPKGRFDANRPFGKTSPFYGHSTLSTTIKLPAWTADEDDGRSGKDGIFVFTAIDSGTDGVDGTPNPPGWRTRVAPNKRTTVFSCWLMRETPVQIGEVIAEPEDVYTIENSGSRYSSTIGIILRQPADPAEKFESIYVPPKLLNPQSAVPRALPAGQLAIDRTNPYAKHLVAAYVFEGCQAVEVVQNLRPTNNSCSLTGGGLHQTGTEWVRFLPPDRQFPHNDNWFPNEFGSMVFTYRNTGSENVNARLIDTNYTGFTIERDTDTALRFRLGADWQSLSGFPNLFNGDEYIIWAEWDESNDSRWIHVIGDDGNIWSTSNFGVWSVGSTTDEISFLNSSSGALPAEGVIRYCLIFDKLNVAAQERTALFQDPYQFIVSKGVAY